MPGQNTPRWPTIPTDTTITERSNMAKACHHAEEPYEEYAR